MKTVFELSHTCFGDIIKINNKCVYYPDLEICELPIETSRDFCTKLLNIFNKEELADFIKWYIENYSWKEENNQKYIDDGICDDCGEHCYTKSIERDL